MVGGMGMGMWNAQMWRAQPIFMLRYCVSSWLMSAALRTCPGPRYAAELRRRVHGLRDEVIAEVMAKRLRDLSPNQNR